MTVSRFDAGTVALCAAAVAMAAVLSAPVVLDGSPLYWQIAAGRWMLENQAVLRIDPFSFTHAGHAWQTLDWLSEVLLAIAYVGAGWSGVVVLTAVTMAATLGFLAWHLSRRLDSVVLFGALVLAFACGAGAVSAAPAMLAAPFLAIWTAGLCGDRVPRFALLPVMAVWANLSGTFVLGLILAVPFAAEAIIGAPGRRLELGRVWLTFVAAAVVMGLLTPNGIAGIVDALRALTVVPAGIESAMPLLLAIPAAAVFLKRPRSIVRLLASAGLFVLAIEHGDDRLLFAIAVPILVAEPLATRVLPRRHMGWKPAAAFLLVAVVAVAIRVFVPLTRTDGPSTPAAAFAHVPAAVARTPVLNNPAFGGFLVFHDLKPFIDDRPLYGANFRARMALIEADPVLLTKTLRRYRIRWTLLAPDDPAVHAIDRLAGWRRLYADRWAVVHVRNDGL